MSMNKKMERGSVGDILSSTGTRRLYWMGCIKQWQATYGLWDILMEMLGWDAKSKIIKEWEENPPKYTL